jgi:hypothetical protein
MLGILASWSVFGNPFDKEPLIIGSIALIYFIGTTTNGEKRKGSEIKADFFIPYVLIKVFVPILVRYNFLNSYLLPLTIFTIPGFMIFYLMLKSHESKALENVPAWSLMYITYLFYAVGFSSLIVLGELGYLSFLY